MVFEWVAVGSLSPLNELTYSYKKSSLWSTSFLVATKTGYVYPNDSIALFANPLNIASVTKLHIF